MSWNFLYNLSLSEFSLLSDCACFFTTKSLCTFNYLISLLQKTKSFLKHGKSSCLKPQRIAPPPPRFICLEHGKSSCSTITQTLV